MKTNAKPRSFVIGCLNFNAVPAQYLNAVLECGSFDWATEGLRLEKIIGCTSAYPNIGLNSLTRHFCEQHSATAEVLVLAAPSVRFTPTQMAWLIRSVSAAGCPVVTSIAGFQEFLVPASRREFYPAVEVSDTKHAQLEFCAIHRDVLLQLREGIGDHWFDFDETAGGEFMYEGPAFFRRVQEYLGEKLHVHAGLVGVGESR